MSDTRCPYRRCSKYWSGLGTCTATTSHRTAAAISNCCFAILTSFISLLESVLTNVFEWGSSLLSIPPCGVFVARESAVVIIEGEDGLGRTIALSFSELGYTVFVLCPAQQETATSYGQPLKSSSVSSLLYIWHKKKQQYAHSSWGLVAPISLDTQSRAQRAHASETIHAYCANHSLHLVAVIVLPQPSPARGNSSNRRHTINSPSNGSLEQDMWEHSVGHLGHLMMEPILMVEDYIDMLKKTSGRVIMLSICLYNQCPSGFLPHFLWDGRWQHAVQNLSYILDPMGIRVSSVAVGPVEIEAERGSLTIPLVHKSVIDSKSGQERLIWKMGYAVIESFLSLKIPQEEICSLLRQIVTSRYPKYSYSLGVHPLIHRLWSFMPDILRLLLHAIYSH